MRIHPMIPLAAALLSCGTTTSPENDAVDPCAAETTLRACIAAECDWNDGACAVTDQTDLPELALVYDGTAHTEAAELPIELRFVSENQAVLRVGSLEDDSWGYGVDVQRAPSGAVLIDTSIARCSGASCVEGALTLEGRIGADMAIDIDRVELRDSQTGALPFIDLRAVPHDGVKPVLNPRLGLPHDPAPVVGVYVGDAFVAADGIAAQGQCVLQLLGEPLTAPVFDCGALSGSDPASVLWDAERNVLNVLVGPTDNRHLLVATLTAPESGTLEGVIADRPIGSTAIAVEEIGADELVGTISLPEAGD